MKSLSNAFDLVDTFNISVIDIYQSHNIFFDIRALKCIVWSQKSHGGKTSALDNRLIKDYKMRLGVLKRVLNFLPVK